ncbi:MAG: CHAT domain-containing protein [Lapillicoccus sp.]
MQVDHVSIAEVFMEVLMERLDYDDFEVVLEGASDTMTARVSTSPVGPTRPVPFVLPGIDDQSLKILVLTMRASRGVRALENDVTPDIGSYGEALFTALFHDESLNALRASLHVSASHDRGLRMRIRLADTPALANVPWELLYDPQRHRFPCQYAKFPVVRFVDVPEDVRPLAIHGPVRMLVVISSPTELLDLDVDAEWRLLSSSLQPLIDAGRLIVDRLPVATLEAVREALTRTDYHVFHFIGHGSVDQRTGEGVLAFTDKYGRLRRETGHDLGVMLSNSPIRLAVLNSCDGARTSDIDPYAGTAASLVDLGIPGVVAMQFEISDQAAIAFSTAMYAALTSGHPIDLAVTLARQAILTTSRSEWATPVLYLRATDGVLFDLDSETVPVETLERAIPAIIAEATAAAASASAAASAAAEAAAASEAAASSAAPVEVEQADDNATEEPTVPVTLVRAPSEPSAPPPPHRLRVRWVAAILAAVLAGGIAWTVVANPFGPGDAVVVSSTSEPTPTTTPSTPGPSTSTSPSLPPTTLPPPTSAPSSPPGPPKPKPADLGVTARRTVDDAGKLVRLSYSVLNGGGSVSTGRTLVITVAAPGKATGSSCKSVGAGRYQCALGDVDAGNTVPASVTVAVPATPAGAFSVVATVTPADGGAPDTQTTSITCSCTTTTTPPTTTTTRTTAPPALVKP